MYEDWAATSITFNGSYSGDPIGDLLLGVPSNGFTALGDPTMNLRMWYQSYYVSDSYKVNSRLTLNGGIRWEHVKQPVKLKNHVGSFDLATNQISLSRY